MEEIDISDVGNIHTRSGDRVLSAHHLTDGRIVYEVQGHDGLSEILVSNLYGRQHSDIEMPHDLLRVADDWSNVVFPIVWLETNNGWVEPVGGEMHPTSSCDRVVRHPRAFRLTPVD